MRALLIDVHSVRFIDGRRLAELAAVPEVEARLPSLASRFAGKRVTNLGVYRAYMQACAAAHPKIATDMAVFARQLAPTERGVGLELICYVRELDYAAFEALQAELFEHLIAMTQAFDLKLFQLPSGQTLSPLPPDEG